MTESIRIQRRSIPDQLRYYASKLRESEHWRAPVSFALQCLAEELDPPRPITIVYATGYNHTMDQGKLIGGLVDLGIIGPNESWDVMRIEILLHPGGGVVTKQNGSVYESSVTKWATQTDQPAKEEQEPCKLSQPPSQPG